MIDERLKTLVDKVLNEVGVPVGSGEDVSYYCPFCKHHRRKFEINLDIDSPAFGRYSCWICKTRNDSAGTNLVTLFRKIHANTEHVRELKSLLQSKKLANFEHINDHKSSTEQKTNILPEQYIPLWKHQSTPEYKNALHYVKARGCDMSDIIRYNIGYCPSGEYAGKIIIPSYDASGQLNFFTGRTFYDTKYGRHKNPGWSKNIIGFELFINWKLPIIIVEGAFDAVAAKRNVIPLFGKTISSKLIQKILEEKVTDIYLALDPDAIRDLVPIAEMFMGYGINTYIVPLPDGFDPNKLGYAKFSQLIKNTNKTTFRDLVKYKLGF